MSFQKLKTYLSFIFFNVKVYICQNIKYHTTLLDINKFNQKIINILNSHVMIFLIKTYLKMFKFTSS